MKNKTGLVILAGGKGTRMADDLPKVLVAINGEPMICRAVRAVEAAYPASKPVVVVGYKKHLVKKLLGNRVTYAWQKKQLGTGHAVAATEPFLKGKVDEVLVLYGDHPFLEPSTIRRLAKIRRQKKAVVSLATVTLPDFRGPRRMFQRFGRVIRDKRGRLLADIELKDCAAKQKLIKEVNPTYCCINASWLWRNLKKLKTHNAQKEYYLTDLFRFAIEQEERVEVLKLKNWVEAIGINSKEDLKIAERVAKCV